jgi:hypothetical protein
MDLGEVVVVLAVVFIIVCIIAVAAIIGTIEYRARKERQNRDL